MDSPLPALERQLARIRRRLFLTHLLASLAIAWAGGLVVFAGWLLLAMPSVWNNPVAFILLGLSTFAAVLHAWLRRPSRANAALALDERFGLQERVTTALLLTPEQSASPAGRALLEDAGRYAGGLRVGERFPVPLPWRQAALLPLGALAVAVAIFLPGWLTKPVAPPEEQAISAAERAEAEKKMNRLAARQPRKQGTRPRTGEEERIQADLERFSRKPIHTPEEVRERIKESTDLQDRLRQQMKERDEQVRALQQLAKQQARVQGKNEPQPGGKLDKALADGNLKDAAEQAKQLAERLDQQEQMDRLRKKANDPKASKEEREQARQELERLERRGGGMGEKERRQLEQELQEAARRLERLGKAQEELARELRKLAQQGKLDPEQLQRELDNLRRNASKLDLDQLQRLGGKLAEARKLLEAGDLEGARKQLAEVGGQFGKMGEGGQEGDLAGQLARLEEAHAALCRMAVGGGRGAGERRVGAEGPTGEEEKRLRADLDRGRLQVTGLGEGDAFKGPRKPSELRPEIQRALQDAPAALSRQPLPASARKMAHGFYKNVGGGKK